MRSVAGSMRALSDIGGPTRVLEFSATVTGRCKVLDQLNRNFINVTAVHRQLGLGGAAVELAGGATSLEAIE